MMLSNQPAKRCFTCVGWTVKDGKVLLVKHKKLGIWLAPGGHVEPNELPHQAAEREFFEETGIKVKAISNGGPGWQSDTNEMLPLPFLSGLHWINKPRSDGSFCEQHYGFAFFVQIIDDSNFGRQIEETDDIGWWSEGEIDALETTDNIKQEARYVFAHFPATGQI